MSQSSPYDVRVQDFLTALTDAHLSGKRRPDMWKLAVQYDIPAAEAQTLAQLVLQLDAAFEEVAPAASFKQELRQKLTGEVQPKSVFGQARHVPPRFQVAAAAGLVVALAFLGRKRLAVRVRQLLPQLRDAQREGGSVEFLNS